MSNVSDVVWAVHGSSPGFTLCRRVRTPILIWNCWQQVDRVVVSTHPCGLKWNHHFIEIKLIPILRHPDWSVILFLFVIFWRTQVLFVRLLTSLLWTSGDVCTGIQSWGEVQRIHLPSRLEFCVVKDYSKTQVLAWNHCPKMPYIDR